MNPETSMLEKVYAPVFEDSLLREIEQKSMLITATAGQGLIKNGSTDHRGADGVKWCTQSKPRK
jgi:hypothetical protein